MPSKWQFSSKHSVLVPQPVMWASLTTHVQTIIFVFIA